jgi:hypothetical protein
MKTLQILLLTGLAAFALACGYSSHSYTNPAPGNVPALAQQVNFGGTAMTTTYVSGNQLMASIPAAAVATADTIQVTVTNPGTPSGLYGGGTQSETSAVMDFAIN